MTDRSKILDSQKPYFIRALYDWIADQDQTVYVQVNARLFGVIVPEEYIDPKTGYIILNISRTAVSNLKLDNHSIEAYARFGGIAHRLKIPISAVLAIYAKETGTGMNFEPVSIPLSGEWPEFIDTSESESGSGSSGSKSSNIQSPVNLKAKGRPNLKILRNLDAGDQDKKKD